MSDGELDRLLSRIVELRAGQRLHLARDEPHRRADVVLRELRIAG